LLAGAAVVAASGTAYAADNVETVVVTGTLIQRTIGDTPTPTVVVSADAIEKTGMPNIGNVLTQLPQVQNVSALSATNSNFLTSGFGISNVDLRDLGSDRTLVLVNGRRQVTGSPTGSSVDLNTIPTALIDHFDLITGGASTAYGSDAVAGVVNIVLKKNFEGIAAEYQNGISSRGDGSETYGTLTLGGNFAKERGNVTVSFSYDHAGAIMSKDRDITATDTTWTPGLFEYSGTHVGPFQPVLGIGSAFSSYGLKGRFRIACLNAGTGQVVAGAAGCSTGSYNPDGTTFNSAVDGFDRNPNRYIRVPVSRKVFAATSHYDITEGLTAFAEATYALTGASQQLEPYPGTSEDGLSNPISANGTGIIIPRNNPYIPAGLQSILALTKNTASPGLFYYRRFADLGDRTGDVNRHFAKITFGLEGKLPFGDWTWSSYYEWGRTEESQHNGGYYDKIKMQNALNTQVATAADIAGGAKYVTLGGINYECSDVYARAAGCIPIDLFGANAISPAAAKYVSSLVTIQDYAEEQVGNIQATGSLFALPAGDVKIAAGAEYRHEQAEFTPDAASQAGTVAGNQQPATKGAFQVSELFAEGILPLVKDVPLIQYLELNGAARWAHYSSAGDAWSWSYRAIWKPVDDVNVRGAYSSSTRAPNISELYSPSAQTFPGFSTTADPCRGANVSANCLASFAAVGATASARPTYTQTLAQGVGGYQSGNPDLKPETSHSLTVGVVYSPSWLSSFQTSIDYYNINIHGYIGGLSIASTLAACFSPDAAPYATNTFCQQVIRTNDPTYGPRIAQINFPTFNLGSIATSGLDGEVSYGFAMSDLADNLEKAGAWSFRLNVNYINSYTTNPGTAGSTPLPSAGTVGQAHFTGILHSTYSLDPINVTTTLRYIGGAYIDRATLPLDLEGNHLHSTWYVDLNVSYQLLEAVELYAGANNLFDNRPQETYPGAGYDDTGTGTTSNVYDPIGQYFYAGVRFKM
jgi:outer membrane receptor protein involved in Fe transport